jgi:hypothetical protein
MTNEQSHMIIAIEQAKMFLLKICPIDELPSDYVRDVVIGFRLNHITMIDALTHFIKIENDLENMIMFNMFLNSVIAEVEQL